MERHTFTLALLLLVALPLAGCSGTQGGTSTTTHTTTPSHTETTTTTQPPPPVITNVTGFPPIILSDCTGFDATTEATPKQIAPGTPPPGWEPDDPANDFTQTFYGGAECNRIHVGPYERGPLRFVWDGHTNADIPAACVTNQTALTHLQILNVFAINDPDIVDFLKKHYGFPAIYAEIQVQPQSLGGPLVERAWSWAPPGQPASKLNVLDDGTSQPHNFADRFWFLHGNGLGQLDVDYTRTVQALTGRPSYGSMQAPMLMPPPAGNFVGTATYYPSMSGEGVFKFYSDTLCQSPEPMP